MYLLELITLSTISVWSACLPLSSSLLPAQWERLKAHNDELSERADTAELQISTFAQEYRKRFQDKEVTQSVLFVGARV